MPEVPINEIFRFWATKGYWLSHRAVCARCNCNILVMTNEDKNMLNIESDTGISHHLRCNNA